MIRRGEHHDLTKPLFDYLDEVYEADIDRMDRYTPASGGMQVREAVEEMPGMGQVIYDRGLKRGLELGQEQGGTNMLLKLVRARYIPAGVAAEQLGKTEAEVRELLDAWEQTEQEA